MNRRMRCVVAMSLAAGLFGALGVTGVAGAKIPASLVEVCKAGSVSNPTGLTGFPFSINGGATFYVPVGACVAKTVSVGDSKVTELPDPSGATMLKSISVAPASAKVHRKITNTKKQAGWAEVDVALGAAVTVTFTNETKASQLKVCKVVAAGSPLIGSYFSFTEQAGAQTVGPFSLQAEVAGSTDPNQCGGLTSYLVGTNVTVTESPSPVTTDVCVIGVTVSGASVPFNGYSESSGGGGSAVATVAPDGTTIVDVTNKVCFGPPGPFFEICVQAGDQYVPAAPPGSPDGWEFTISGNGVNDTEWVPAGNCSGDVSLFPGQYTVTEDNIPFPWYVSSINGDPTAAQDVNLANGSAEFEVGANVSETAVFTNSTLQQQIKVCTTIPDNESDSSLVGVPFSFNVTDDAGTQVVTVTVPAIGDTECSVDPDVLPQGSTATVTEQSQPNVQVSSVSVAPSSAQGSGTGGSTAEIIVQSEIASAIFTNVVS